MNGIEINSSKEYADGSYDKKSRVFVADKGINVSNEYINYTTYRQQYNAKTKTYTDKAQSPLIDKNGNVIGEQESIEVYSLEDGERQIQTLSSIENENGIYNLETFSNGQIEKSTLMIDNKLSGNKENISYINEDGKETYVYMENGVIGQKVTKTDRGTTIDIYKDGKPFSTYEYDENGNMTKDLNKKILNIQYNCLNLPSRIEFENGHVISYLYDADGIKLRTTHIIGSDTTVTDYCGNVIYENGIPVKLLTEAGYVTLADSKYHYFVQDHLGNNRVVVDQSGNVEEVNHYYPFGGLLSSSVSNAVQPY